MLGLHIPGRNLVWKKAGKQPNEQQRQALNCSINYLFYELGNLNGFNPASFSLVHIPCT